MSPRRRPRPGKTDTRAGRPTTLTPTIADTITEAVAAGNAIATAATTAGVPRSTVYAWLTRGQDARDTIDAGATPDPRDEPYLRLLDAVSRAHAQAEADAIRVVQRAMTGGELISEEPVVGADGQVLRDEDGEVLMKRTWTPPDGRLALEYVARRNTAWAKTNRQHLEIVGADGLPVTEGGTASGLQVASADALESIAARLHGFMAERRGQIGGPVEEGDVHDGEVVEGEMVEDTEVQDRDAG